MMSKRSSNASLRDDDEYSEGNSSPSKRIFDPIPEEKTEDLVPLSQDDPDLGMFLIETGTCHVIHKYDGFNSRELRRWDFFGESELLKVVGYSYFGDIVAVSDEVRILFISNANFKKIPVYE